MIVRVFKRTDGSIIIGRPSPRFLGGFYIDDTSKPIYKKIEADGVEQDSEEVESYEQRELTLNDCNFGEECNGLDYIDIDDSELPEINSDTNNHQEKYYIEDGKIKKDESWELMLMPSFLVKKKHLANISESMDAELAKESPDPISLIRLFREHEKAKSVATEDSVVGEIYWAQKALEGLERAPVDKTAIKAKLETKITELEAINASNDQENTTVSN